MQVPKYIADRIRRPAPADCCVLEDAAPLIGFGDWHKARIATIGINPGLKPFLHGKGQMMDTPKYPTLPSLGIESLSDASDDTVAKIYKASCHWFLNHGVSRWFKTLEQVTEAFDASYADGSACHLDIVQWATKPSWSRIDRNQKKRLLEVDIWFFQEQLRDARLKVALLNGRTVCNAFRDYLRVDLEEVESFTQFSYHSCTMYVGRFHQLGIFGWSTNLQSSPGVKRELAELLGKKAVSLFQCR